MNELFILSFIAVVVLFLINLALFLFYKPAKTLENAFTKWRLMFFVMVVAILAFSIHFFLALDSVSSVQTVTNGSINYVITSSEDVSIALHALSLSVPLTGITCALALIHIVLEFQIFGRPRFSDKYLNYSKLKEKKRV